MSKGKKTKVSLLINSLIESKMRYIEIQSQEGETAMKIKLNIDNEQMVDFLDEFYDAGFVVKKITKSEYDDYDADEKLRYNL